MAKPEDAPSVYDQTFARLTAEITTVEGGVFSAIIKPTLIGEDGMPDLNIKSDDPLATALVETEHLGMLRVGGPGEDGGTHDFRPGEQIQEIEVILRGKRMPALFIYPHVEVREVNVIGEDGVDTIENQKVPRLIVRPPGN